MIRTVIGGIINWFISSYFNNKSNKNLEKEIKDLKKSQYKLNKYLSEKTQRIIINSKKENMSIKELNEILLKKTMDFDIGGPLPYKSCPKCGNSNLDFSSSWYKEEVIYSVNCNKCYWGDWADG